jgi:aminoglycoside phosphotransferase (APT) family kinase protein
VSEVLARHRLPEAPIEIGAVGSFPTFLVGRHVVKLFGERFFGELCHEVERSLQSLLHAHPEILAPAPVAEGRLFAEDQGWPWPYLVSARLDGIAWHAAALARPEWEHVARQLGQVVRRLHTLPPPPGPTWERDWLAELRAGCVERQRRWSVLPPHLVDQIAGYLAPPSPERRLIHADLHDHHIFVQGARLVGIIDWGDALLADPYYELPALHLHTFRGDRGLLATFLDGYGWGPGTDFAHRAMTMALIYEFNVLDGLSTLFDLHAIGTLAELADLLWGPP